MKYAGALVIKFLFVATAILSIFSAFQNPTITGMLFISLLFVTLSFILGDLFVLRKFGTIMAVIADFALAFIILFFYGSVLGIPTWDLGNATALSAFFISLGEAFFHFYLVNRVFGEPSITDEDRYHVHNVTSRKLRTETSDEVFPYDIKRKKKKENKDE